MSTPSQTPKVRRYPEHHLSKTYFGVKFSDLDDNKIQQLLAHYNGLSYSSDRVTRSFEFLHLFRALKPDEIERISAWYHDDGELPPIRSVRNLTTNSGAVLRRSTASMWNDVAHGLPHLYGNELHALAAYDQTPTPHFGGAGQAFGSPHVPAVHITGSPHAPAPAVNTGSSTSGTNGTVTHEIGQTSADQTRMCSMCVAELPLTDFPSRDDKHCCHAATGACHECTEKYIMGQIEYGDVKHIGCHACHRDLTPDEIKMKVSELVWQRYEYLLQRKSIPSSHVICLAPHCDSAQAHESSDPKMTCNVCNFQTCVHHGRPWHTGMTCAEFDAQDSEKKRAKQNDASAIAVAKMSQNCPNCKRVVTKDGGCDHLKCVCGHHWCFECLHPWTYRQGIHGLEAVHAPNCKHTRAYEDMARRFGMTEGVATVYAHPPGLGMGMPTRLRRDEQ